jgi:pimeloyl-ACP methyl ester carboxylesterase
MWEPVVALLGPDVSVATPTLRWFGADPWPDDGAAFGTESHTEQLIRYLEERAGGPTAAAAWSYSTHVLLNAMRRRPDLFDRTLLYEPGLSTYLDDPLELKAFAQDATKAFGPVAAALAETGPTAAVEALFDSSGGPGCFRRLTPERQALYLESGRMMPLLMGGGQPPANLTAEDLSQIPVPVTVAMGEQTRDLFALASRAVARSIPGARLKTVSGADHMMPETAPHQFAALLREWLRV